jgi:hypothetical protein
MALLAQRRCGDDPFLAGAAGRALEYTALARSAATTHPPRVPGQRRTNPLGCHRHVPKTYTRRRGHGVADNDTGNICGEAVTW